VDNRDGEGVAVLRRSGIAFAFSVLSAVSSFAQSFPKLFNIADAAPRICAAL